METLPKCPHFLAQDFNGGAEPVKGRTVGKKQLVNKLNAINFRDGTILVNLVHNLYNRVVSRLVKPQPCLGDRVDCLWVETEGLSRELKSYHFQNLLITDGREIILLTPEEISLSEKLLSFRLPSTGTKVQSREMYRHPCEGIRVTLLQNSASYQGTLNDFNPLSLSVEISTAPPQTFQWIDTRSPVNLVLAREGETLYSNDCRILRDSGGARTRTFVLQPLNHQIRRFKPKEFRSERQSLIPSPNVVFLHPFTRKIIDLKVVDLSGTGFSVEEDESKSVLLPGMIIPELELNFAHNCAFKCRAQVVYRNPYGDGKEGPLVKSGMAILDMDIKDHVRLLALLHQAKDRNSYICNPVDLDALWNFFFETGFIYPEKYAYIQANKEKFRQTYEKLYTKTPNIARHFIYQRNGTIYGHMAMLRFYRNSWLIQHHAAGRSATRAGVQVLHQVGCFANDSYGLYSLHMDYLLCYFRPENKFPSKVFGGAAREIDHPKGCSLDTFAYFHFRRPSGTPRQLPHPWELGETNQEDLIELSAFYEYVSGGLMINALDLEPGRTDCEDLNREYATLGLKRERHIFSLKKDGALKAVVMFSVSDMGLNMSELTNCAKVIILDPDDVPKGIIGLSLSILTLKCNYNKVPVLLYPVEYADKSLIAYNKLYTLWVLNTQYSDEYFRCVKKFLK
jgi:hypothetical protein